MTIDEIKVYPKPMLVAAQVAPIIGCDPATLRWQAKNNPMKLGFPATIMRNRVYIPKIPFMNFIEGKSSPDEDPEAS